MPSKNPNTVVFSYKNNRYKVTRAAIDYNRTVVLPNKVLLKVKWNEDKTGVICEIIPTKGRCFGHMRLESIAEQYKGFIATQC